MMERLAIIVTANGSQAMSELDKLGNKADRDLGKLEKGSERAAAGFTAAGTKMMVGAGLVGAGLYKAGQAASELEQSVGGSEAVFKEHAKGMGDWAKTAAETVGLSEQMARSLSTRLGGALKGLGYETEEAAEQSKRLTAIAADLAATYGGTTAEAVQALGSALRGEFDPAEQFNLFLKQSTVDAKAVEMGLAKTTNEVSANARAQATLALVTEQSADAQGQFAREADTAAGKMQRAKAATENQVAALGEAWLPIQNKAIEVLGKVGSGFTAVNEATDGGASSLLAYGVASAGVVGALSSVVGKVMEARKATGGLEASMTMAAAGWAAVAAAALTYKDVQDKVAESNTAMAKSLRDTFAGDTADQAVSRLERVREQIRGIREEASGVVAPWDVDYKQQLEDLEAKLRSVELAEMALMAADQATAAAQGVSVDVIREKRRQTEETTAAIEKAGGSEAYIKERTEETTKAITDKTDALDKAISAIKKLYEEQFRGIDAQADYEAAVDETYKTLKENGLELTATTEKGRENAAQLRDQATAAMAYAAEIGRTEGPDAGAAAAERMRVNLIGQLQALGMTKEAATLYVGETLKLDGKHVRTTFEAAGLVEAANALGTFGAYLEHIARTMPTTIEGAAAGVAAIRGRRERGGPVKAGEAYIVGEKRAEIFVPERDGMILPDARMDVINEDDPRWNARTMGNGTGWHENMYYENGQRSGGKEWEAAFGYARAVQAQKSATQRVEVVLTDQHGRNLMSFLADLDGRVA